MRNVLVVAAILCSSLAWTQTKLSPRWEELTADDFRKAVQQSEGVCLLPFGIVEKHGPHLPLGTDLLNVRHAVLEAVKTDFAVVFPEYYFGQIFEARHEPGTIAYSASIQMQLLQETTDEMARNGCKKVLIVNGHGGNEHLLPYFAQTQLDRRRDYVIYILPLLDAPEGGPPKKTTTDMHAGEKETSEMLITRPDLVHQDRAEQESGGDQKRLDLPDPLYTAIWWYARFPFHYSGEGAAGNRELGEYDMNAWTAGIQKAIRAVKADKDSLRLQNEFFEKTTHPLDTPH
ncbi:MAG TPA: creatininase family protein [Terriglobales bacterium]|nr:creatininase family protein [Terriglobales bacterium]